ncbi:hypothetical protein AK823_01320 [Psychrobacter sp. P2G3]|nr:hypothetical protein AK823_01320 [Psychrobacter sp. P2G3]
MALVKALQQLFTEYSYRASVAIASAIKAGLVVIKIVRKFVSTTLNVSFNHFLNIKAENN